MVAMPPHSVTIALGQDFPILPFFFARKPYDQKTCNFCDIFLQLVASRVSPCPLIAKSAFTP
jgi:hypothetical protein